MAVRLRLQAPGRAPVRNAPAGPAARLRGRALLLGELVDLSEEVAHLGRVEDLAGCRFGVLAAVPEAELEPSALADARHLQLAQAGEPPPQRIEKRTCAAHQDRHMLRLSAEAS